MNLSPETLAQIDTLHKLAHIVRGEVFKTKGALMRDGVTEHMAAQAWDPLIFMLSMVDHDLYCLRIVAHKALTNGAPITPVEAHVAANTP